jgi:hypothetical protein
MFFVARYLVRRIIGGPLPPTPEFDADEQLMIKDAVLRDARERLLRDGDWRVAKQAIEAAGTDWARGGAAAARLTRHSSGRTMTARPVRAPAASLA